ncbi:MAG: hypothetical protein WD898_01715 [Candidatus Paceibacterota bacterium]
MRAILWLDLGTLRFFNKISKDLSWLTGFSNFVWARISLAICAWALFKIQSSIFGSKVVVTFWLAMLIVSCCGLDYVVYVESAREQLKRAKDSFLFNGMRIMRLSLWLLILIFYWFNLTDSGYYESLPFVAATVSLICWAYFLSIDRPPFQRSGAWQRVKRFFAPAVPSTVGNN